MRILKEIDCPLCDNMGFTYDVKKGIVRICECVPARATLRRLRESGLADSFERYTFDAFETKEPWQQDMKDVAVQYVEQGAKDSAWLFLGGNPGSGKSHLATAVLGKLIENNAVRYIVWTVEVQKIKAVITEAKEYEALVNPLRTADVLLIDDFFKPGRDIKGLSTAATISDIRVAFDIINYRYLNNLPTILSSELFLSELADIDEAVASRIYEKCGEYKVNVARDVRRNHRYADEAMM